MATTLGTGSYGTAYLVNGNVLKLQKIYAKEREKNLKYTHWREVDVMQELGKYQHIAYHIPKLIEYKVDANLPYAYPVNGNLASRDIREIQRRNESPYTFCIKMTYVGIHVHEFRKMSPKSMTSMMCQIINLLYDINALGYSHNDIHADNIMRADKPCTLKIAGEQVEFSETFSLIDYGLADHAKISGKVAVQRAYSHQDIAYLYLSVLLEYGWDEVYKSYITGNHPIIDIAKEYRTAQKKIAGMCPALQRDIADIQLGENSYSNLVTAAIVLAHTTNKAFQRKFHPNYIEGITNIRLIHDRTEHLKAWLEIYRKFKH